MRVVRNNVFETNSSSIHSIAISKNEVPNISGQTIYFGSGEYGWGHSCVTDTAAYLHTAIVGISTPVEYEYRINKIKNVLDKYNVKYKFEPVKYTKYSWDPDLEYVEFVYTDGYIDHVSECRDMVNALVENEDLLLRYLFGNSCIYTGNDNEDYEYGMCNCADPTIWDSNENDDYVQLPNPNYDPEHYDYFMKEN